MSAPIGTSTRPAVIQTRKYPVSHRNPAQMRRLRQLAAKTWLSGIATSGSIMAQTISSQPDTSVAGDQVNPYNFGHSQNGTRAKSPQTAAHALWVGMSKAQT